MIAISFLSNLFLGPILVGYMNDKSDKKFPCLLYGVLMSFSCLLRQIRNPLALLMSQITLGMSSSFLNSCFENWMVSEINNKITDKNVKEITLSAIFEKSMIGDSFTIFTVTLIAEYVKGIYGIQAPFFLSIFFSVICIIACCFLITSIEYTESDNKDGSSINKQLDHDFIDVLKNFVSSLIVCVKNPFIIIIGITESMLLAILHIFQFSWTPALRELKDDLNTSEVFTIFMIALILGGTSFRVNYFYNFKAIYFYFNCNSLKVVKIISLFSFISYLFVNLWITYRLSLYSFLLYQVSVGMLYPTYSKIKCEFLPAQKRGTLMNILKIPLNIFIIYMILTMNSSFTLKEV
jgi:hypothetical protein